MSEFMKLLGVIVAGFIVPFAVIVYVYFGMDNASAEAFQKLIVEIYVSLSVIITVGGYLLLIYQDLSSGRYSKKNYRG